MDSIKLINELNDIGWFTVVLVILILITLIPNIIDNGKRFLNVLGLETKSSRIEKERISDIKRLQSDVSLLKVSSKNRREKLDSQIEVNEYLVKEQAQIKEVQNDLKNDVANLTNILEKYIEQDKAKTVAMLRTSLWTMHKEFVTQGYVTPDGLKTFEENGKIYEANGGDDIYHEKLLPEVMALDIVYAKK